MANRENSEGRIPSWLEAITPGATKAKELKNKSPKADRERRERNRRRRNNDY